MGDRTRKLSAKEFFSDITEKNDATSVSKPKVEKDVNAGGPEYLHEGGKIHPAMKEARRLRDAEAKGSEDDQGWYHGGEPDWDKAKDEYNTKASDYATLVGQDLYSSTRGKEPFNKNIKTADDMEVYAKEQRSHKDPTLKNMQDARDARAKREANNRAKGEQFEKNLHRFDRMDSKKNPGGWAKEFFRDLHDKEVK